VNDVLIVGGGPAGLAAAGSALARGASVVLVDGGLRLGGQLLRQPLVDAGADVCPGPPVGPALPSRFQELAAHPRLRLLVGRSVWSISRQGAGGGGEAAERAGSARAAEPAGRGGGEAAERAGGARAAEPAGGGAAVEAADDFTVVARLEGGLSVSARAVVLATGASELLLPFTGWELPGVVSAGGAQSLLKAQHQLIGRRVLVAGSGPFLLPVAAGLAETGAKVLAVVEALPLRQVAAAAPALAGHPSKLVEAGRYLAALARRRVPLRYGQAVVRCEGEEAVRRAVVARLDSAWRPLASSEQVFEVDAVCVSFGFVPRLELARQLGVDERASPHHPGIAAACDAMMASSVPGVFVAGELTGVAGGEVAEAEGSLAGAGAALYCGHRAGEAPARLEPERRRLDRAKWFADRLVRVYRIGGGLGWAGDETIVCRCEDVTAGAVRSAIASGARSVRELRNLTRCGMGYCQGRTCGPILQLALAESTGTPLERCGDLQRRPVAVPVPLGEVARS
jgi:thioredoxin reductase/bacterioferritin-associated ferredoxin